MKLVIEETTDYEVGDMTWKDPERETPELSSMKYAIEVLATIEDQGDMSRAVITVLWTGYFETLLCAEIIVVGSDDMKYVP